ncbi:MAG: glycosyltransferase family 2 protein [Planctomycetes bacterium]|nr:glycosyltransferase family 2 protein [Planctomycetota bacterium]
MKAVVPAAPGASSAVIHGRLAVAELKPALSVVVVNYRSWGQTARLVRQLRTSRAFRSGVGEVVIVDNHSPPHPLAARLRRLEGVSLRRWGRNRGFARAVNEGARLSRGRWILLLNPDVTVGADFLEGVQALADRLDRDEPQTGIVGLGVRNDDGSRQPSTGPFPTLLVTLSRLLLPRAWRKCHLLSPTRSQEVPWATGCALLVRRRVLDELGGLDPDFFLYYEDVDLCRRARQHGWSVRHEPGLQVTHQRPLHARAVTPLLRLLTRHALLTYAVKHWPRWQAALLARLVRAEAWWKAKRAAHRGDLPAARMFAQLGCLAAEMQAGDCAAARCRLERVVRWREKNQPAAPARAVGRFFKPSGREAGTV